MESWRSRKTLILSRTDMMGLVTPAEYVSCVEQAYRMHGEGRYYMDPKGHIVLDKYPGEWEAMPSYIEDPEAAACKWVSIRERGDYGTRHPLFVREFHADRERLPGGKFSVRSGTSQIDMVILADQVLELRVPANSSTR